MSARVFDPLRLDVQTFAGDAGELSGRWPLRQFERLGDAVHRDAMPAVGDEIAWSARGEQRAARGVPGQNWLHLRAQATLRLECQRCLQPVETELALDRWFHFVPGEDAAAQLDADSEDDVLALTRALDLRELVEDELLLALPLVPRHPVCPAPLLAPSDAEHDAAMPDRPNPFAALAALKRGGSLN
jgi:uncharacterized protein